MPKKLVCALFLGIITVYFNSSALLSTVAPGVKSEKSNFFAVVMDADLELYKDVARGIAADANFSIHTFVLLKNNIANQKLAQKIIKQKPKAIITIGPKSTTMVKNGTKTIPIIYCLVPHLEKYDFKQQNMIGISMELQAHLKIAAIKAIIPGVNSVGIIYTPRISDTLIKTIKDSVKYLSVKIVTSQINSSILAANAFKKIADKIDVLWFINDPSLLTVEAVNSILKLSQQHKIPVFALNRNMVYQGALIGLALNYNGLGKQAAQIANNITKIKSSSIKNQILIADKLEILINTASLSKMANKEQLSWQLLKYATSKKYTIKAI